MYNRSDREILDKDYLSEPALAQFILGTLLSEMELARPLLSTQDQLLGYSLPDDNELNTMADRTAAALKARPSNKKSVAWQKGKGYGSGTFLTTCR